MQVFCHIDIQCRTLVSSLGRGYFNPSEKNSLEKHITCTNKIHFTIELSNSPFMERVSIRFIVSHLLSMLMISVIKSKG